VTQGSLPLTLPPLPEFRSAQVFRAFAAKVICFYEGFGRNQQNCYSGNAFFGHQTQSS
jgi:hypothetical protein